VNKRTPEERYTRYGGSVLPLYSTMWVSVWVSADKTNTTSTDARLATCSCTCVRTAFYHVAVIFHYV
jgi:hypothetical protein